MPSSVGASFKLDLPAVKAYTGRLGRAIMEGAGAVLEVDVKRMLSHPGTGNEYPRQGGRKMHTASAPGEPPAVDTGRLRASITYDVSPQGDAVQIGSSTAQMASAGAPVNYAQFLEFGTERMKSRPFMRPVAMQYMGNNKLIARVRAHLRRLGFEV